MSQSAAGVPVAGKNVRALGVVTLILGFLAIMAPMFAGALIAVMVGVLVLVTGIFRVVWAFHARTLGHGVILLLLGGLTVLCGGLMVTDPIFASGVLTILLTIYFVVEGVSELIAGFQAPAESGRGMILLDGMLSLLLGILIWIQYPLSGAWAIGILFGIKLIFIGLTMLMLGKAINREVSSASPTILEVPAKPA